MRISQSRDDIEPYSRMDIWAYNPDRTILLGNLKKERIYHTNKDMDTSRVYSIILILYSIVSTKTENTSE